MGRWTSKHAEAIYGTTRGLPFGHFFGPTTLSKDRKTIYCFILNTPKDDITLKGIKNNITQIRLLGTNEKLISKRIGGNVTSVPGILRITLPAEKMDLNASVIAIELDSPLKLYRAKVGAIEEN